MTMKIFAYFLGFGYIAISSILILYTRETVEVFKKIIQSYQLKYLSIIPAFFGILPPKTKLNENSELNDPVQEMIRISSNPVLIPRMPYGKHKRVLFSEVPEGYLQCLMTTELDEDMAYTVRTHLGLIENNKPVQ